MGRADRISSLVALNRAEWRSSTKAQIGTRAALACRLTTVTVHRRVAGRRLTADALSNPIDNHRIAIVIRQRKALLIADAHVNAMAWNAFLVADARGRTFGLHQASAVARILVVTDRAGTIANDGDIAAVDGGAVRWTGGGGFGAVAESVRADCCRAILRAGGGGFGAVAESVRADGGSAVAWTRRYVLGGLTGVVTANVHWAVGGTGGGVFTDVTSAVATVVDGCRTVTWAG